jgi:hypothetical protein
MKRAFLMILLCGSFGIAQAQEWYLSNPSGMALEKMPSRTAALHQPWALQAEKLAPSDLPENLAPYYEAGFSIERRVLYERGKIKRRQWLFRDSGRVTRLNASFGEGEDFPPFIEIFSADGFIVRSIQLGKESSVTLYSYSGGLLLSAETRSGAKLLWTDKYRYTRSGKLRGVERDLQSGADLVYLRFPPPPGDFISPEAPYEYTLIMGALQDVFTVEAVKVVYSTDDQGRVLTETRYDGDGKIAGEISNTWTGGRISEIKWSSGTHSGRIELEYDGSERIGEKDYRNGVLERTVRKDGDRETEELYINGKPVLRAVWEEGRKISEERL